MGKESFYTVTSLPRNRLRTKILQSERRPQGNTEGWCYKVSLTTVVLERHKMSEEILWFELTAHQTHHCTRV